jgi:tetratricopeptide (TPR) repeat protein
LEWRYFPRHRLPRAFTGWGLDSRYFRGKESLKLGINLFQQALDQDSGYAAAYAEMAQTYSLLGAFHYLPIEEANSRAIAAAKRAIDLDETLAEAHVALGDALIGTWSFAAAESELQRAIELNPNLSGAHTNYGTHFLNSSLILYTTLPTAPPKYKRNT